MKKIKHLLVPLVFFVIIACLSLGIFLLPDKEVSLWERRKLQQFPEISLSALADGSFMKKFETYLADQFPLRDSFRSLKAKFHFDLLRQKDNNDIFVINESAGKLEKEINKDSLDNFTNKLNLLYDSYLEGTDCRVYFSVIPDKAHLLTENTSYPQYSFSELYSRTKEKLPRFEQLDITPFLSASSYYSTDSHWKQEEILPAANHIRKALGLDEVTELEKKDAGEFYGVYCGQSALPLKSDRIFYLTNEEIASSRVTSIEKEGETEVYDLTKLDSPDKYDIFLSGAVSLLEINNPHGSKGKELIIFRDSFSSSLAPLLIPGYSKITMIDTRYILPSLIKDYVTFDNQDVLFIYSAGMVNYSVSLK